LAEESSIKKEKPGAPATRQHLFWARELVLLARKEAAKRGVPDYALAQAMLVQAWILFTGQGEREAKVAVSRMFTDSIAKSVKSGALASYRPPKPD
jgi:hypothetical protein